MKLIGIIISLVIIGEIVFCLIKGASASSVMYYICRPFGIPMKLIWGLITRIILILIAGSLLMNTISLTI